MGLDRFKNVNDTLGHSALVESLDIATTAEVIETAERCPLYECLA
jgi:GGDEF domain-containing protein